MTQINTASSGSNANASGAADQNKPQVDAPVAGGNEAQTVAYDTYLKVLDEKKKTQEKLREFEKREKDQSEAKLKEQGDYQKMLEVRESELLEERTKRQHLEGTVQDALKMNQFRSVLTGNLDPQYVKLVDLDKIAIDPATGRPDEASVVKYAREFEKEYDAVIRKQSGARLPNNAAQGSTGKISYEEWSRMPLKEKKTRLKDVLGG